MCRISLLIPLIVVASGCASPKHIDKALLVPPPLPDHYLTGNLIEYYPNASNRAHETGEVILNFTVAANGIVNNVAVNEQRSVPYPRLLNAATKMVQGLNLAVDDNYKTSLSMSIVFEIAPCGNVPHSPGPDYYTFLCVDPTRQPSELLIPEFVHWYKSFDSKLRLDQQKRVRDEMNGYAKSLGLPALKANGPDQLRVWVGHFDHSAIAGFVVSNSSVRKCMLPADPANSGAAHCTERNSRGGRQYLSPLKELASFNGHRLQCILPGSLPPESDVRIDIEWVTAGKRFAVQSNEPSPGFCRERPFPLIAKIITNAGWQTPP